MTTIDIAATTVKLTLDAGVATLTLARPERLNAVTPQLFEEATRAIEAALDGGMRALVLTGEGRAFCSGADLHGRGDQALPEDPGKVLETHYNPFVRLLASLPVPVVTAINGLAAGAGCSLALCGDISVMARSAYLLLAFVNIGLVPDAGASWLVARSAGRARALEMALLGERMPAEEALRVGLVTRVVEDAEVMPAALALVHRLAAGPTVALGLIRRQIADALSSTLDETLAVERRHQALAGRTQDFAAALVAFATKQTPRFEGR